VSRVSTLRDFGLDGAPGVLYTQYDPAASYLIDRAASIRGKFTNTSTKILVAGCGPGSLVKMLTDLGYTDVWGCDLSTDLINYGKTLYPAIASRLLVANCLNNSGNTLPSMTGVRRAAGLTGNNRFALCITDDLLTVMSDAEVATCLTVLRATASTLLHVLWPIHPGLEQDPSLNWKTVPAGWQTTIGGGEWVMNAITGQVYGANGIEVL
jgi:SAM-dependent methyltransferase